MKELRFVLRRVFQWKIMVCAAILLTILQCGMELRLPRLMAEAVDNGVMRGNLEAVRRIGYRMAILCAAMGISGYGSSVISAVVGQRLALGLREELYGKISALSVRQVSDFGHGALLTRLTVDINACSEFAHSLLVLAAEPILLTAGGIWMMWHVAPTLGFVFAGFVLIQITIMLLFIRTTAPGFQKVRAATDMLNSRLQRVFGNFRLIKAYHTGSVEEDAFTADNSLLFQNAYAVQRRLAVFNPLIMLVVDLTVAMILYLSGRQVAADSMNVGAVLSAVNWSEQILLSVAAGGRMFKLVAEMQPSAERIMRLLDTQSNMPEGSEQLIGPFRELRFENVSFAYEQQAYVLRDISFTIRAGETLAVIGPVGCGKTTLAALCARLYDVRKGRILINGQDLRSLKNDELRRLVALSEKQAAVLEGTVLDNIVFGRENIGKERAVRAAHTAQMDEYLQKSPEGFDTFLLSMGKSLSGGERQRLCIARALAGGPALLILDDSTSSLDYLTERRLLEAIRENDADCAVLMITNRLPSAMRAQRILVLDENGRRAAEGTVAQLLSGCALFRKMYDAQMRERNQADGTVSE